ncbi:hypothetical protein [Bacillus sp. FJAT-52991]|uniref:Uncharacterized protein n=1 Tax=Bacillus kandeliae TaxID=3129297 RepID=A0ABZ2N2D8_9BACI
MNSVPTISIQTDSSSLDSYGFTINEKVKVFNLIIEPISLLKPFVVDFLNQKSIVPIIVFISVLRGDEEQFQDELKSKQINFNLSYLKYKNPIFIIELTNKTVLNFLIDKMFETIMIGLDSYVLITDKFEAFSSKPYSINRGVLYFSLHSTASLLCITEVGISLFLNDENYGNLEGVITKISAGYFINKENN